MADSGVGRPIGASPSTDYANLSGATASTPTILITATAPGAAVTVHTGDLQATDVVYLYAFNNSAAAATIFAQPGSLATTAAIPLTLSQNTSSVLIPGLPIGAGGVISVWNSTASTGVVVWGSVQRTFI